MKTDHRIMKRAIAASLAVAGMASLTAQAYGPLYIFDYAEGTPYRWDVTEPVPVYTDGGNFASGTVRLRNPDLPTCNADGGWVCYEDVYVEFTNKQGVDRVKESLASWSAVPTSTFQAEVAGNFADLGIGGDDGDITGAEEEFTFDGEGNIIAHEILGTVNGGGIHVVFDEDGDVMRNVLGVPYGVLGVASPEWADEETGIITEGWVFIGGGQTYYNDENLAQMAGVITHELGHSFNLAHTQTNGHLVMYGNQAVVTAGPTECSAHWYLGGEYDLPFPQSVQPTADDMAVMYPYINNNPTAWPSPTGQYQATVSTPEDFAAISSIYPAPSFASETGTLSGTVTYPFGRDGIIGVNIVARNLDNPYQGAITVMSGDWNDGVQPALQAEGEWRMHGVVPGRYVVHVENIFAGGFPTPTMTLPGPSEYWNGSRESDDARFDDACDYEPIVVAAGETRDGVNIQVNGTKRGPRLVINPAPNANFVSRNGQLMAGTVSNNYGEALSWVHHDGTDDYLLVPMGGLTLSENGSMMAGRVFQDDQYLPARMVPGGDIELLPLAGNNACDQGGGIDEYYSHFTMSPNGDRLGGFLWNCDNVEGRRNFIAAAATWSETEGWTVLDDHYDELSSRVNALSNEGTAVGWAVRPGGWWEGRVWKDGETINLQDEAPEGTTDVGEATAVSADGRTVVGINVWDVNWNQRGYVYDVPTGTFTVLDIAEECPWWDWFCFGAKPFNPYAIADDGTMVGAIGTASGAGATLVNDVLGTQKLTDFLRGQGVINANDLGIASTATSVSRNGRHIVGWTAVDGYFGSWKLSLDQLWVCRNGRSQKVGYPGGVADQLAKGAELGLCAADLPKQYKDNY